MFAFVKMKKNSTTKINMVKIKVETKIRSFFESFFR